METRGLSGKLEVVIAGLAAACALVSPPAAAGASGYKNLSARILGCAETNALKKIAVLEFTGKGGAGKSDTDYAAENIGLYLTGSKKTVLIERALLARVLRETRLSSAAGGATDTAETLKNMLSLDGVVTGTVFPDGEKLRVLARLIELKTGRVLLAAESEAGRLPRDTLKTMFESMELSGVPMPELPSAWSAAAPLPAKSGFRDALSDSGDPSCRGRKLRLDRLNSELVDAKAGYWANKMREPGFKTANLTRNPGSEIRDPELKARFYKLLAGYAGAAGFVPPGPDMTARVAELMKLEKGVSDECGLY